MEKSPNATYTHSLCSYRSRNQLTLMALSHLVRAERVPTRHVPSPLLLFLGKKGKIFYGVVKIRAKIELSKKRGNLIGEGDNRREPLLRSTATTNN